MTAASRWRRSDSRSRAAARTWSVTSAAKMRTPEVGSSPVGVVSAAVGAWPGTLVGVDPGEACGAAGAGSPGSRVSGTQDTL